MISTKKGIVISRHEKICKSFFSHSLGLMFRRKQNLLMIFPQERKVSLHMLFVFHPIDVLIVGVDMHIKEIKKKFHPFTFWSAKEKGKYVVELGLPHPPVEVGGQLQFSLTSQK